MACNQMAHAVRRYKQLFAAIMGVTGANLLSGVLKMPLFGSNPVPFITFYLPIDHILSEPLLPHKESVCTGNFISISKFDQIFIPPLCIMHVEFYPILVSPVKSYVLYLPHIS